MAEPIDVMAVVERVMELYPDEPPERLRLRIMDAFVDIGVRRSQKAYRDGAHRGMLKMLEEPEDD